jgi:glutathione S-transferase
MIELYGPARSSAGRCIWLLEELGVPYENKKVDLAAKEHKADWFLKINPNGKVPALVDGDVTLFESMAINFYLAEKYKPELLGNSLKAKAQTHQWSYWAVSEVQGPMIEIFIQKIFMPEDKKDYKVIEENEKILPAYFQTLDNALSGIKFLNGNEFTLADLNVASVISIAHPIGFDMSPYKNINAWMGAIAERPSFGKYMALRK